LGSEFLITTETGNYAFLSDKDFSRLISGQISDLAKTKYSELEKI